MKVLQLIILLFISSTMFGQNEGQSFCEGDINESYFPISIKKKKVIWQNTFYLEIQSGEKNINGVLYSSFEQLWEGQERYTLYLREENGVIYQYEECCKDESIRYNPTFDVGYSWKTADQNVEYTIESLKGTLKTPYCNYENLLVLESKFVNGTFKFYYLKGFGYVGTTIDNELISFVSPE